MTMEQAPEYVSTIRRLGEEYKHEIEIYVGFEAEYLPEFYEEQMIMFYQLQLEEQMKQSQRLQLQMKRFEP